MNEIISVIVPIYNTSEYLPECLDSIVGQTYRELEIILVDDGSTDASGRIADVYAAKDGRIRVIHKKNGGVTAARNTGIDHATGTYVAFVDSDDAIHPLYFETLIRNIEQADADICFCISHIIGYPEKENKTVTKYLLSRQEGLRHLLLSDMFGCAVNKMYRAKLWDGLRIRADIVINEDLLTNFQLFSRADRILFFDDNLYLYRHREGSASRSGFNRKQLDTIKVNRIILDSVTDPNLTAIALKRYCGVLSSCHRSTVLTSDFEHDRKKIEAAIRNETSRFLTNPHLSLKKKCELLLQGYASSLYCTICKLI